MTLRDGAGIAPASVYINPGAVEPLLRESLTYPAVDTSRGEVLWLYRVPQQDRDLFVFASGELPYRADAHFNLHRWNQANFALT